MNNELAKKCEVVIFLFQSVTQLTFTCSKPTIETLEKGIKYVQN